VVITSYDLATKYSVDIEKVEDMLISFGLSLSRQEWLATSYCYYSLRGLKKSRDTYRAILTDMVDGGYLEIYTDSKNITRFKASENYKVWLGLQPRYVKLDRLFSSKRNTDLARLLLQRNE
jgi:hypothetical protein